MPNMRWLAGGFDHLQLDIVGFLAILGEASVNANAQVSFLSPTSLLPRLLPAPQALIRTTRPRSLAPDIGKVIGAHSGSVRDYINHIAHLVHSQTPLAAYAVRCEHIKKSEYKTSVSAKHMGPLAWLHLLGTAMSLGLLCLAIVQSDGFALIATLLLSLLSSIIGFGSQWSPKLMTREQTREVPEDIIITKYPNGAFLIVKCDENIARELYWHPEECNYTFGDTTYRILSLFGTMMLMFGVICLANSTLSLQVAFAAAYMILNAAYWIVAALPQRWHWDLSCYEVTQESYRGGEEHQNFTQALWKAIAITSSVEWVKNGQIAPVSEGWTRWVEAAGTAVVDWKGRREASNIGRSGYGPTHERSNEELPLPEWEAEKELTACLNPNAAEKNV